MRHRRSSTACDTYDIRKSLLSTQATPERTGMHLTSHAVNLEHRRSSRLEKTRLTNMSAICLRFVQMSNTFTALNGMWKCRRAHLLINYAH